MAWRLQSQLPNCVFGYKNSYQSLCPDMPIMLRLEPSAEWWQARIFLQSQGCMRRTPCCNSVHLLMVCRKGLCGIPTCTWNMGDFDSGLPHDPHARSCNTIHFREINYVFSLRCCKHCRIPPSARSTEKTGRSSRFTHVLPLSFWIPVPLSCPCVPPVSGRGVVRLVSFEPFLQTFNQFFHALFLPFIVNSHKVRFDLR